jgi:iron complex transport system substrate-binding protein
VTVVLGLILVLILAAGCRQQPAVSENTTVTVVDQLGRRVELPKNVQRIATVDHIGGLIIFALGQQDKQVHQSLYGKLGRAMAAVDRKFAALPQLRTRPDQKFIGLEELTAIGTQVVFVKASFDKAQVEQMENVGIKAVAIKGETLEDSFEAVRLMAKVLGCEDRGREYITDCQKILDMVRGRIGDIPAENRPRVIFTGPKSIFSVASGEMLQTLIIERAGGQNAAAKLKGFWADVSPEQVAAWNPDVIFLGSTKETYGVDDYYNNPHLQTVKAVKEKRVFIFPSNIDWWDYPAPHYVLGTLWAAKILHPDKFADVDMIKVADEFYGKYLGHSFTELGGKL